MSPIYYIVTFILTLVAIIATIMIGNSQENREGNPAYDKSPGKNMFKITLFYVVTGVLGVGSLIYVLLFGI